MNYSELIDYIENDVLSDYFEYTNGEVAIWQENGEWQAELFMTPRYSNIYFKVKDIIEDNKRLKEITEIDPEAILVVGEYLVNACGHTGQGLKEFLNLNYNTGRGDEIIKYLAYKENFRIRKF